MPCWVRASSTERYLEASRGSTQEAIELSCFIDSMASTCCVHAGSRHANETDMDLLRLADYYKIVLYTHYSDGDDLISAPWIIRQMFGLDMQALMVTLRNGRIWRATQCTWVPALWARVVHIGTLSYPKGRGPMSNKPRICTIG